jgi:hypothetical protein
VIKSRRMIWTGHGAKRNAYRILMGKLVRKRPLGRPRGRLRNNIKMNLGEAGVVWTGLI